MRIYTNKVNLIYRLALVWYLVFPAWEKINKNKPCMIQSWTGLTIKQPNDTLRRSSSYRHRGHRTLCVVVFSLDLSQYLIFHEGYSGLPTPAANSLAPAGNWVESLIRRQVWLPALTGGATSKIQTERRSSLRCGGPRGLLGSHCSTSHYQGHRGLSGDT